MDTNLFIKGMVIGFSIAAPVGPIGVLCIRRTLADGFLTGLVSGLGAATADAMYGVIAAFGLTAVSAFIIGGQIWLRLVGGVFLCYLGIKTLFAEPSGVSDDAPTNGLPGAYSSTFFLTLTNPLTILSFAAIFAGLGLIEGVGDYLAASLMVLGVFVGSASWWLLLSGGVSLLRSKFTPAGLRWVNRIAGVIIAGFGVLALISVIV